MFPRAITALFIGYAMLLVAVAACGAGTLPWSPVPQASSPTRPAAAIPGAAGSPAAPTPTPTPTPVAPTATRIPVAPTPVPAGPPIATLSGLSGDGVPGDLGSFSWDGLASDAPWVVGRATGEARTGAVLAVSLPPNAGETAWRARWAPLTGDQPGTPIDGGSGGRAAVALTPPATPGPWSLQLIVDFGPGRSAAWYWRVEVVP